MSYFLCLVYLVLTFIRPGELIPALAAYPVMDAVGALALASSLLAFMSGRGPTLRAPQIWLVLLFVVWAAFSVLVAQRWLGVAVTTLQEFAASLSLFFLLVLNVDSPRRARIVAGVLVVCGVVAATPGILAYHFGFGDERYVLRERADSMDELMLPVEPEEEGEPSTEPYAGPTIRRIRSLGFLADPNDLAQALLALLPFAFVFRRPGHRAGNLLRVWAPAAIFLYGSYLTFSRGGAVALLALVYFAVQPRVGRTLSLGLAIMACVGLLAFGFTGGRSLELDESVAGRTAAWREGLQMLKSSPVWGVGYRGFTDYHERTAHNSFVLCFAELGLVGYYLWLAILVLSLIHCSNLARSGAEDPQGEAMGRLAGAVRLSLIAYLAGAFFLSRTYNPFLFLVVGVATALGDLARRAEIAQLRLHAAVWLAAIGALELVSIASIYFLVRLIG